MDGDILEVNNEQWDIASRLKPDFKGFGKGDRYITLLSYRHPPTGIFLWSVGFHDANLEASHQMAIAHMADQLFHYDIGATLSGQL